LEQLLSQEGILNRGYYRETSIYTAVEKPKKLWTDPEHMRWHLRKALEECESILRLTLSEEQEQVFREWRAALWGVITRSEQEHLFGSYLIALCRDAVAPGSSPDDFRVLIDRLSPWLLRFTQEIQESAEYLMHSSPGGTSRSGSDQAPRRKGTRSWCHEGDEKPPSDFTKGPVSGNLTELAQWICPEYGRKPDPRGLKGLGTKEDIWIYCVLGQSYKVYFKETDKELYARVNLSRLAERQKQQEEAGKAQKPTK